MTIHWSWFSFIIGFGAVLLIETLATLAAIAILTIRTAKYKPHPLFNKDA